MGCDTVELRPTAYFWSPTSHESTDGAAQARRHRWSLSGQHTGHTEFPARLGREQARAAGELLLGMNLTRCGPVRSGCGGDLRAAGFEGQSDPTSWSGLRRL